MAFTKNEILVSYRCPNCGDAVLSMVGIFALTGDRIVLKCSCNNSSMTITKTQDNKLRFKYPCMFCEREHTEIIPLSAILSRDLLTFPCSVSGFDSLFIGTKGKVLKAIEDSNDYINDFLIKSEIDDFKNGNEKLGYDLHILDLVIYTLKDMAVDGKIICDCKKQGKYVCTIEGQYVNIHCDVCNKCEKIDCSEGSIQARDLFDRTSLTLTKDYTKGDDDEDEK